MDDILKQQAAEQAPPVNTSYVTQSVREIRESAQKESHMVNKERAALDKLSITEEWEVLKQVLGKQVKKMRSSQNQSLLAGLSLESIGLRSLIVNEIDNAFTDMINLVEKTKQKAIADAIKGDDDLPDEGGE